MSAETPGRFGAYGGRYASEALIAALDELDEARTTVVPSKGAIGGVADGVVVGSAIVDRIGRAASPADAVDAVASFIAELKAPLRS